MHIYVSLKRSGWKRIRFRLCRFGTMTSWSPYLWTDLIRITIQTFKAQIRRTIGKQGCIAHWSHQTYFWSRAIYDYWERSCILDFPGKPILLNIAEGNITNSVGNKLLPPFKCLLANTPSFKTLDIRCTKFYIFGNPGLYVTYMLFFGNSIRRQVSTLH